ncbi:MAG: hypothetical protein UHZ01_03910 [Prevotella sp.]|nr:hypothetical protein [Prevotella sp.]
MVKMNESAANIKFMECRMKGRQEKFVMQMEYPQCLFQVHEFESTQHYLDTLHQSKSWVHTQVGCRNMALTFNGCMMHYEFGQDDASEKAKQLIEALKEAARWYDGFLQDTPSDSPKGEEQEPYGDSEKSLN